MTKKYPVDKPLPRYKNEFLKLTKEEQEAVIHVQKKYPFNWWNPYCKTTCTGHNKVHKFSFESYVEGWVKGYFGFDTVKEMMES